MPKRTKHEYESPLTQEQKDDLLLRLALTERKLAMAVQKLESRDRELDALYRLAEAIDNERHTGRIAEQTAAEIGRTLGIEDVCVMLRDEQDDSLTVTASTGSMAAVGERLLVKESGHIWSAMKSGKPHAFSSLGPARGSIGNMAGLAVPIKTRGKTFGVIYVSGAADGKEFSSRQMDTLCGVASQTAVALHNAALHHDYENLIVGIAWSFASALDAKSRWTAGHSKRVTQYAVAIAEELGHGDEFIHVVQTCGLLHDIGKIGVPEVLLDKPHSFTAQERMKVCEHATLGAAILQHIDTFHVVIPGVKHHHERWDGKGFPDGLAGEAIPLLARVLAVADAFDAITSDRPYHQKRNKAAAIKEIKRCSGSQFDPLIVEAFVDVCMNNVFRDL